jgi:hypothetical protein
MDNPKTVLLAAQSLIYSKILRKEEMQGAPGEYPHTRDEADSAALVSRLSYDDCKTLYRLIKRKTTVEARALVRHILA